MNKFAWSSFFIGLAVIILLVPVLLGIALNTFGTVVVIGLVLIGLAVFVL